MSLKKILLSSVIFLGAASTSTIAKDLDEETRKICESTCNSNSHCTRFPESAYTTCRGVCGNPYAENCKVKIKNIFKDVVEKVEENVPLAE